MFGRAARQAADSRADEEKTAGAGHGRRELPEGTLEAARRYGMGLLAAVVLLPTQLVLVGVAVSALIYVVRNVYVGRRRGEVAKGAE